MFYILWIRKAHYISLLVKYSVLYFYYEQKFPNRNCLMSGSDFVNNLFFLKGNQRKHQKNLQLGIGLIMMVQFYHFPNKKSSFV